LVGIALVLIGIASLYLAIRNRRTFTKSGATALVRWKHRGELAANSLKDGIVEQLFTGNSKAAAA